MKTDNSLTLPDGRKLAYAEFGQPDGHPVLYFHGSPGSRLEPLFLGDDVFSRYGLRIIAPDRPGMGQSDFQPRRGFVNWCTDMVYLADVLKLKQFSVLGISGGTGYAAACAAKIPERLYTVVIVSGVWQLNAEALKKIKFPSSLIWNVAAKTPFLLPVLLRIMNLSFKGGAEKMLAQLRNNVPTSDYAVLEQPGRLDVILKSSNEAMRQGVKGVAWDIQLYASQWDFGLNEIKIPIKLFHGEQDMSVPVENVLHVMKILPTAQLVTYCDEGHLSTSINHCDEIFKALVSIA